MNPLLISLIVFACVFGGATLGLFLHRRLPDHHLASETKDAVKLTMALVSTMVAMVLGLLVGSAKSFFDTQNNEIAQLAANTVLLDRVLAEYGPKANDARQTLRTAAAGFDRLTLSHYDGELSRGSDLRRDDHLYQAIRALSAETDDQRFLKSQASGLAIQLGQTRWLMFEQRAVPVPTILLGVLVFWLVALFISFGVFAKPNTTLIASYFVSSFAVSAAVFLIIEMYHPYTGLIQVSNEPIRAAITQLGH